MHDDELEALLKSVGDVGPTKGGTPPSTEEIWAFAFDELSADQAAELGPRIMADPEARRELETADFVRQTTGLRDDEGGGEASDPTGLAPLSGGRRTDPARKLTAWLWLGAAAAAAVVIFFVFLRGDEPGGPDRVEASWSYEFTRDTPITRGPNDPPPPPVAGSLQFAFRLEESKAVVIFVLKADKDKRSAERLFPLSERSMRTPTWRHWPRNPIGPTKKGEPPVFIPPLDEDPLPGATTGRHYESTRPLQGIVCMADVLSWEQVQKLEAELNEAVAAKADLEEQKRRLQATGIVESVEVTEIVPR